MVSHMMFKLVHIMIFYVVPADGYMIPVVVVAVVILIVVITSVVIFICVIVQRRKKKRSATLSEGIWSYCSNIFTLYFYN